MDGWWCVRYGDALAWVEAPSAPQALLRSLDLRRMGDWTDDARRLVVFPQDDYPEKAVRNSYKLLIKRRNNWIPGSPFVPFYVPFLADVDGFYGL